jgi:hypothetical protein
MFPYAVQRRHGIERLVKRFRRTTGLQLKEGVAWPETETDMLNLQRAEPRYAQWIGRLRLGERLQVGSTGTMMELELPEGVEEGSRRALRARTRQLAVVDQRDAADPARKSGRKKPRSVVVLPPALVPLAMRFCHECNGHPGATGGKAWGGTSKSM